jgi:hypothetical protein
MLRSCRDLRPVCIILITLGAFYFVHLNRDKCSDSRCSVEDKPYVSPLCNCSKTIPVVNADALDNNRFRWCSIESDLRGHHQRVVTYSIYGNASDPVMFYRYYSLMKQISLNVEKQYPGWVIRFYHNFNETDHLAYTSLCDIYCRFDHVDLCSINDLERQIGNSTWPLDPALLRRLNKRMYRFLVMLDPQVDVFLSRDADSLIIPREVDAVHQWLRSNYTFHLMRDHPAHLGIMLAGK